MADGLYIGMTGAVARSAQLDAVADNLANAQTVGFKAERAAFETFLAPNATADTDKRSVAAVSTAIDLRPGAMTNTRNPLDVLPQDNSWFVVKTDQGVAYTRNGQLKVDADFRLLAGGYPVLDRGGGEITLPPNSPPPTIDAQGQVRVGQDILGELDRVTLEGQVERRGEGIYGLTSGEARQSAAAIQTGVVELSNSNAMQGAIDMIAAQRNFESAMQALQTYRRMDDKAIEVGRTR